MGTITSYETAKGRRDRVRYYKPNRSETQKRGFTTMREAQLYLSMVTVSKSKGEHIDPTASRVPVRMFADSWLKSKQPPMSKPSYYVALSGLGRTMLIPSGEIGRSGLSAALEFRIGYPSSRPRNRVPSWFALSESSLASSTSPSTTAASRIIRPATSATFLETDPASAGSISRTITWRRWLRAQRIRRSS